MLGKLTQDTLGGLPSPGALTRETLNQVPNLGTLTRETLEMVERLEQSAEVEYRGYLIHPTPKELRDTPAWTLEVQISRDRGGERRVRLYAASNTFPTREEAIAHAIVFAQRVIDGQVPECTVNDL